jgi:beta-lactamase superfamily II metal-dependent hydrolase
LLDLLSSNRVEIVDARAGDSVSAGSIEGAFIWPPRELAHSLSDNDSSLVAVFSRQNPGDAPRDVAAVFTGDIQSRALAMIMSADTPVFKSPIPILEAPHHGSFSDEAEAFVGLINPDVVVQSTGPRRASDVRWENQRRARSWLTTALRGHVWCEYLRDGSVRIGGFTIDE